MGNSYYNIEKSFDTQLAMQRKKKELQALENTIIEFSEKTDDDNLTEEQLFLIEYYGLDQEDVDEKNFGFYSIGSFSQLKTQEVNEDVRYDELICILQKVKKFDEQEMNSCNDRFHKKAKSWKEFASDFDDPVIVKKMRLLQLLNKMAHQYEFFYKEVLYGKNPQLVNFVTNKRVSIEGSIKDMFLGSQESEKKLVKQFGYQQVDKWKNDKALKYCAYAINWMFGQKDEYLEEVLKDLQNTNEEYNYGVLDDGIIFDVPGYGQFGVHLGNSFVLDDLIQEYQIGQYQGQYLENVIILRKADPELLKEVNYEKLSNLDKQRYDIARLGVLESGINIVEQEEIINPKPERLENGQKEEISAQHEMHLQEEQPKANLEQNQLEIEPSKEVLEEDVQVEPDNLIEEIGDNEEPAEQNEINLEYEQIRRMTSDVVDAQQSIEDIKLIIGELKAKKSELKQKIKQMNEEINEKILDSDEPTVEVIQDIIELRNTVKQLEKMRKAVKEMIKRYKENKKQMKKNLQQEIDARNSAVDEVEL